MPMSVMDINVAKSMESLQQLANLDCKSIAHSTTDQLCKSARKLYLEAEKMNKGVKNQEKAFIYYFKFIDLVIYLQKKADFQKHPMHKMLCDNASSAMPIATDLKSTLTKRYELLNMAEMKRKEAESSERILEVEINEGIVNSLNSLNLNTDVTVDRSITAVNFFSILKEQKGTFLILDVRPQKDFEESHLKHSACLSVPQEILSPGLTAQKLENNLPSATRSRWNQRNLVDYVIMLDWDTSHTTLPEVHPFTVLEKALIKWDLKNPLKKPPLMLTGGYKDWLLRYPMYTTKAIDVLSSETQQADVVGDISSIDYPNLDADLAEELGPQTVAVNRNLLDSGGNNALPGKTVQNGWVKPDINNQQPTVHRHAKPQTPSSTKRSDSLDSDPSGTGKAITSIRSLKPEVNRSLKPSGTGKCENLTEGLQEEENVLKESLTMTQQQLRQEKEYAELCLRRELEAEELKRMQIQEQEEILLRSLKKVQTELEEQEQLYLAVKEENVKMKKILANVRSEEQKQKEVEIQNINRQKKQMQEEVEKLRQLRKLKEKKEAEAKPKSHSAADIRTEHEKSVVRKDQVNYPPAGEYTQPLKDLESAGDGASRGLTRSYSSPNIAQMMAEENKKKIPAIDRTLKPKFDYNQNYDRKIRSLSAIYGHIPGRPVTGLRNLGNTCYMNSIIQCLSNTELLAEYINKNYYWKHIRRNSKQGTNGEVIEEFGFIIKSLWTGQYKSFSPKDFKNTASKYIPMCVGYEQQDSHEFLVVLMDKLHGDLNQGRDLSSLLNLDSLSVSEATEKFWEHHNLRNSSIISQTFEGYLKSTLTCMSCSKTSNSYEVFSCLSLPIASSRSSLKDSLTTFLKTEKMCGEAAWDCPNCRQKKEAEKTLTLCKLPNVLIIQLKRFSYEGLWRRKIQSLVNFPQRLDMQQFCMRPRSYSLYGIVNHFGYLEGGHYTAFCKNPNSGKWYKYDDHEVSEISPSDIVTSAAYLLFYSSNKMGM